MIPIPDELVELTRFKEKVIIITTEIPLINSIPYVKDWLDEHPQKGNPNAPLICGYGKSLVQVAFPSSCNNIYDNYKNGYVIIMIAPSISFDIHYRPIFGRM
jgi:hypothetical protein